MIQDKDTLPYQQTLQVNEDTLYFGSKVLYPGDSTFSSPCSTFEKVNNQIINLTDANCLSQGLWMITDTAGNYWTGIYKNGRAIGVWKRYNKMGYLLEETETINVRNNTYTVTQIDYSSGKAVVLIDKPFLKFYLRNLLPIMIVFFVSFFSRIFINSRIYNRENRTNYSVIYFYVGPYVTNNFEHSLICTFTFWFHRYISENRKLVFASNTLSIIALGIFFGILVGLIITGEI